MSEPKGCPVKVWDGPYSYRCGLGASVGRCAYHGPFDPSLTSDPEQPCPCSDNGCTAPPPFICPKAVAQLVEDAERKGYQHGYDTGLGRVVSAVRTRTRQRRTT